MKHVGRFANSYLVFLISLSLTLVATLMVDRSVRLYDEARFGFYTTEFQDDVIYRMETYVNALLQARSAVGLMPDITREQFQRYVTETGITERFHGIQGIGFTLRISPEQLAQHERRIRASGLSGYRVWPETPRDEYYSIVFLEPLDWRNQRALGFDMHTEPTRRAAMDKARDTGEPAMSGKVTLVQETESAKQPGFLIYVPVYREGAPVDTVERRRAALLGFIYSPFRGHDLFNAILSQAHQRQLPVDLEVYDGEEISDQNLLFDRDGKRKLETPGFNPRFANSVTIDVAGHRWKLQFYPLEQFSVPTTRSLPLATLLLGLLVSSLLFGMVRAERRQTTLEAESLETRLRHRGRYERLVVLRAEVSAAMARAGPLEEALRSCAEAIAYGVRARSVEIRLVDPKTGMSACFASVGDSNIEGPVTEFPLQVEHHVFGEIRLFASDEEAQAAVASVVPVIAHGVQRRKAEEALREAVRARDEFLSIASHELKTPLTSLKLQLQMTYRLLKGIDGELKSPGTWERLQRAFGISEKQMTRLVELIEELLDVSRIASGRLQMNPVPVNVADVVADVIERFEEQAKANGCVLCLESRGPVEIRADRFRVEQVIVNLISNAVKYGSGKPVHVHVECTRDGARISVKDEGMGIPPEKQSVIFDRFERAVGPTQISGLGLGLYISKQVVEAHRGRIRVESEPGQGSTFIVDLPRNAAEA